MTFEPSTDRRSLLKTTAGILGLATTGGLAGCLDSASDQPQSDGGNDGRTGSVPSAARGVGYLDVDTFLSDAALRDGINQAVGSFSERASGLEDPPTVERALDQIQDGSGLDPRRCNEVLGFYQSGAEERVAGGGASVLWTDWSNGALVEAFGRDGQSLTEEDYRDATLHYPEYGGPLALLGDGTFAVGSERAVKNAIDVRAGEDSGLSGTLGSAYGKTRGVARYASVVPDDATESVDLQQFDGTALQDVSHLRSSVYATGSKRAMDISLRTPSLQAAKDVSSALDGARQLALGQVDRLQSQSSGVGQVERFYLASAQTYLDEAVLSTTGSTVTVSYSAPPAKFVRNSPAMFLLFGMLVNTAGFVQSTAEETGQRSAEQVTNRLQVVSAVGTDIANERIGAVELVVKKAPGAADIDLSSLTMQWLSRDGAVALVPTSAGPSGSTETFGVDAIKDPDGSIADGLVLNDTADRARIRLDVGDRDSVDGVDTSAVDALEPGESVTVRVTTRSGGETTLRLTVPQSLSGKAAVAL
jgi:flagellin FlaB